MPADEKENKHPTTPEVTLDPRLPELPRRFDQVHQVGSGGMIS